eukprot:1160394-Pelagomonas_calceolata.AAC.5
MRISSSIQCLIVLVRVDRSFLRSASGASKFLGVPGKMSIKLQNKDLRAPSCQKKSKKRHQPQKYDEHHRVVLQPEALADRLLVKHAEPASKIQTDSDKNLGSLDGPHFSNTLISFDLGLDEIMLSWQIVVRVYESRKPIILLLRPRTVCRAQPTQATKVL